MIQPKKRRKENLPFIHCGFYKIAASSIFDQMSVTKDEVANTMSHKTWSNRVCAVFNTLSRGIRALAWSREHCLLRISHHPLIPPPPKVLSYSLIVL